MKSVRLNFPSDGVIIAPLVQETEAQAQLPPEIASLVLEFVDEITLAKVAHSAKCLNGLVREETFQKARARHLGMTREGYDRYLQKMKLLYRNAVVEGAVRNFLFPSPLSHISQHHSLDLIITARSGMFVRIPRNGEIVTTQGWGSSQTHLHQNRWLYNFSTGDSVCQVFDYDLDTRRIGADSFTLSGSVTSADSCRQNLLLLTRNELFLRIRGVETQALIKADQWPKSITPDLDYVKYVKQENKAVFLSSRKGFIYFYYLKTFKSFFDEMPPTNIFKIVNRTLGLVPIEHPKTLILYSLVGETLVETYQGTFADAITAIDLYGDLFAVALGSEFRVYDLHSARCLCGSLLDNAIIESIVLNAGGARVTALSRKTDASRESHIHFVEF